MRMELMRAHPYISALLATTILLISGFFIVQRQGAATPSSNTGAWDGANLGVLSPTSYGPAENAGISREDNIMQQVQSSAPYTYIPPSALDDSGEATGANSFDLDSFIKMIGQGSGPTTGQNNGSSARDVYSFIPSGLMSTTTPLSTRSDTQEALYNYGNEVGSTIQSFEEQHPTSVFTLKDHAEDRNNPQKAAAVEAVARALEDVGQSLLSMEGAPGGVAAAHDALGQSYISIGTNLALVAKSKDDTEFLKAIEVYNASADTFIKNYVSLAQLLGAYNVVFSPVDSGSVFTFTPAAL